MKTKHMLMACILTAAVTSPSARANIFTSLFKNTDNVSQDVAYKIYKALPENSDNVSIANKINKKWVQDNPEEARHLARKVTTTPDGAPKRSDKQRVLDGRLSDWQTQNQARMKELDDLLAKDKNYAEYIAKLSEEWDATNPYLQAIQKNPKKAIAATGAAAGIAGGAGITYAIMKPEKGSTVTVTRKY